MYWTPIICQALRDALYAYNLHKNPMKGGTILFSPGRKLKLRLKSLAQGPTLRLNTGLTPKPFLTTKIIKFL